MEYKGGPLSVCTSLHLRSFPQYSYDISNWSRFHSCHKIALGPWGSLRGRAVARCHRILQYSSRPHRHHHRQWLRCHSSQGSLWSMTCPRYSEGCHYSVVWQWRCLRWHRPTNPMSHCRSGPCMWVSRCRRGPCRPAKLGSGSTQQWWIILPSRMDNRTFLNVLIQ